MIDFAAAAEDELAFRPDVFFLAPTRGRGVVRDRFGRLLDRCEITTEGRWDHNHGALRFDEVFDYESGRSETLSWAFGPDAQGRLAATEASVTSPVRGRADGQDYCLTFKRRGAPPPLQKTEMVYEARFTLMEPDTALKSVKLKLFGITLGLMVAYHRRVIAA